MVNIGDHAVAQWEEDVGKRQIYPIGSSRPPTSKAVPSEIAADYEEACRVLPLSPKASAALSRRCLQAILRDHGYSQRNLADQIDTALGETDARKSLPSHIAEAIDAIRNFGNFSAHPLTDETTLQIIEVDPGEAEWCIEITEDLFDHYYVKPETTKVKMAGLNQKLTAAKKPHAK